MMQRIDPETLPYRPCVGIIVFNREGLVWAGRRKEEEGGELTGSKQLWQMPQGGIDEGEDPEVAARRELYEETGIRTITLLARSPDWLTYDLPPPLVGIAFKGRYRGQKQLWFAYRFDGEDDEVQIDPPPDGSKAEFDRWTWMPLEELPEHIVPFKRGVYREVVAAFTHFAASPPRPTPLRPADAPFRDAGG